MNLGDAIVDHRNGGRPRHHIGGDHYADLGSAIVDSASDHYSTNGDLLTPSQLTSGGKDPKGKEDNPRWIMDMTQICKPLTHDEQETAYQAAEADLFDGKIPVDDDKVPHILFSIGPPGGGKTTLSRKLIETMKLYPVDEYIDLDHDMIIKYHPRYKEMFDMRDSEGHKTGIGYGMGYIRCGYSLEDIGTRLFEKIFTGRYNAIIHTHAMEDIIYARRFSYRATLLYVAVDLLIAQKRALSRANIIGRFLAQNTEQQNNHIARLHGRYKVTASWYSTWCNDFYMVDNNVDNKYPKEEDFIKVDIPDNIFTEHISVLGDKIDLLHTSLKKSS